MNPVLKSTCALALLCTANAASSQISGDAELAAHIRAVTNQSDVGLTPVTRADGSIEVDLKGRFQHAYVAQLNPAGQVVAACVGSVVEANAFFGRDLETGKALPKPKMSPAQLTSTAALHGMTEAEYAFYWGLIEQAKFVAPTQKSSTFAIINSDGANEGFNSTVARPADGANNAPTLGGQRLALFNSAASVWAAFLDSTITINVQSNFDSMAPCSSMGGTLA